MNDLGESLKSLGLLSLEKNLLERDEERVGPIESDFSLGGNGFECSQSFSRWLSDDLFNELKKFWVFGEISGGEFLKKTTGDDGGEKLLVGGSGEDKEGLLRWFFDGFQKSVLSRNSSQVSLLDPD